MAMAMAMAMANNGDGSATCEAGDASLCARIFDDGVVKQSFSL